MTLSFDRESLQRLRVFQNRFNDSLFSRRMIQGGMFGGQVMGGTGVFGTVSWSCVVLVVLKFAGFF